MNEEHNKELEELKNLINNLKEKLKALKELMTVLKELKKLTEDLKKELKEPTEKPKTELKEELKKELKEESKKDLMKWWKAVPEDVLKAGVMLCALVVALFFAFVAVYLFREKVVADLLDPTWRMFERCPEIFQTDPASCIDLMVQILWWSWLMVSTIGVLLLALVWSILRAVVEYPRSVESAW